MVKVLKKIRLPEPGEGVPVVRIGEDSQGKAPPPEFREGLAGAGVGRKYLDLLGLVDGAAAGEDLVAVEGLVGDAAGRISGPPDLPGPGHPIVETSPGTICFRT